jgi:hypothetical protein
MNNFFDNLLGRIGNWLPDIVVAILILIIGFIVAGIFKRLVIGIFRKTGFQKKLEKKIDPKSFRVDKFFGIIIYYVIVIYTLLLVLDVMGVRGVLNPLNEMLQSFLSFLPNILAAGIILYAGYIIAKIAAAAVGFFSDQITKFSEKMGAKSSVDLSKVLSQVVFLFVFIPIAIIALDTLELEVISGPASNMLNQLLMAIPNIIAAALLLIVFFIVGKFVSMAVTKILQGMGADKLSEKMHLNNVIGQNRSVSSLIGDIIMFFIIFSGVIAAVEKLKIDSLTYVLGDLLDLSGSIFLGLIVLAIGNFFAQLAYNSLVKGNSKWVAQVAKFAIWGLFISIGLSTMGIGEEVVQLAFALSLGAVAVAFALSFGLGGREPVKKMMERWLNKNDKPGDGGPAA